MNNPLMSEMSTRARHDELLEEARRAREEQRLGPASQDDRAVDGRRPALAARLLTALLAIITPR